MRATVYLEPSTKNMVRGTKYPSLPVNYGKHLMTALLEKIAEKDPQMAVGIHDGKEGYTYVYPGEKGNHFFKPLCFSRLQSEYRNGRFILPPVTTLEVGWREDVVEVFTKALQDNPVLVVGDQELRSVGFNLHNDAFTATKALLKTASPVVVMHPNERKTITCDHELYCQLLAKNLVRKTRAVTGRDVELPKLTVLKRASFVTLWDYNAPINATNGSFLIEGDPETIQTAYRMGLGNKNAMGFGMMTI